jgi:protocatechuate 3,4-dioxygenase beta subunit
MRDFTEATATEAFLARLDDCQDARLRGVMAAAARHLHAFVREVRPTHEEWLTAIQFLTRTGQICDAQRQEWILLSDVLAVSMLVDAINHPADGAQTESTVLGPFHVAGSALLPNGANICRDGRGRPCVVQGRVLDAQGAPISGAVLDVWQTTEDGWYDVQQPGIQPEGNLRGKFETDAHGCFWFVSVKPASYPIPTDGPVGALLRSLGRHPYRPAHIHFIISAPGFEAVTTHIFAEGDPYLDSDAVFGVKSSLIDSFQEIQSPEEAERYGVIAPFWMVSHEFRLDRASLRAAAE